MREKILAQLKAKYPGVSLKVLEHIAKKLEGKVADEAAIEGAITEFDDTIGVADFAALIQSEGDRRVTEALKKKPKADETESDDDEEPAKGDDPVSKQIAALTATVQQLQKSQKQGTVSEAIHKQLSDKKIPLSFIKGRALDLERGVDEQVAEIEADYTAFKQDMANIGFAETTPPSGGAGSAVTTKAADADIADWAKKSQPAQPAAAN